MSSAEYYKAIAYSNFNGQALETALKKIDKYHGDDNKIVEIFLKLSGGRDVFSTTTKVLDVPNDAKSAVSEKTSDSYFSSWTSSIKSFFGVDSLNAISDAINLITEVRSKFLPIIGLGLSTDVSGNINIILDALKTLLRTEDKASTLQKLSDVLDAGLDGLENILGAVDREDALDKFIVIFQSAVNGTETILGTESTEETLIALGNIVNEILDGVENALEATSRADAIEKLTVIAQSAVNGAQTILGTEDIPSTVTALANIGDKMLDGAETVLGATSRADAIDKLAVAAEDTLNGVQDLLHTEDIPTTVTALSNRLSTYLSKAETNLDVTGVGPVLAKIAQNYIDKFNVIAFINPKTYFNNFQKCSDIGEAYSQESVVPSTVRDFNSINIACSQWSSNGDTKIVIDGFCTLIDDGLAHNKCIGATTEVSNLYPLD